MDTRNRFYSDRKTETRNQKSSHTLLDYSKIQIKFDENIADIRRLFEILDAANNLEKDSDRFSDILRYQVVFLESTLDTFLHDLLLFDYEAVYFQRDDSYDRPYLTDFKVSLKKIIEAKNSIGTDSNIRTIIKEELQRMTFMRFDAIREACASIGITMDSYDAFDSLKPVINELFKRRNQIVHQTDRKSNNPNLGKTSITRENVNSYIESVCSFQKLIAGKYLKLHPGLSVN